METVIKEILTSGAGSCVAIVTSLFLVFLFRPYIENRIILDNNKLLENLKAKWMLDNNTIIEELRAKWTLDNNKIIEGLKAESTLANNKIIEELKAEKALIIEKLKAESTLLAKRYDIAQAALRDLAILGKEVNDKIRSLHIPPGQNCLDLILTTIHPEYNRLYSTIRLGFETANDGLSSYSLEYQILLHQDNIKKLIGQANASSPSDIKRAYRRIWLSVSSGMAALLRVMSNQRFWETKNYGEKSDRWAKFDRERTEAYLLTEFNRSTNGPERFYLLLERDGAQEQFWRDETPQEWEKTMGGQR